MMASRTAVMRSEPPAQRFSSSPSNKIRITPKLNLQAILKLASQKFDVELKREIPSRMICSQSLTRRFSQRPIFTRRQQSTLVPTQTSIAIRKNLDQFQRKTIQEQRKALIAALQEEYQYNTDGEISQETMKKWMESAKIPSHHFSRYRHLLESESWDDDDWEEALRIMLICYGNKCVQWVDDERKASHLKTAPSIWNNIKIDLYLSKIAEKSEFDKIRATEIIVSKLQESAKLHQIRRVIAVYEGVWHGLFLINLYQRLHTHQFHTKIVGTDINPLSVALFSLYAKHIGGVPSKDFFVFFNDVRRPLLKSDLEQFDLQTTGARILNLYFRTLIDLREPEVDAILDEKSRDMNKDDCLICTLAEDSPDCQEALQQVGLTTKEDGKHFSRYYHVYKAPGSVLKGKHVESSVLVLRQGMFTPFVKWMQNEHHLQIDHHEQIEVAIDLLKGRGHPFQANLLILKKSPII